MFRNAALCRDPIGQYRPYKNGSAPIVPSTVNTKAPNSHCPSLSSKHDLYFCLPSPYILILVTDTTLSKPKMHFTFVLTLLSATLPFAFTTPFTYLNTTNTTVAPGTSLVGEYYLQTSVISDGQKDKDGLYVSGYHTGEPQRISLVLRLED